MKGLMQDWPLRVSTIIDHAARFHGDREIVTRSVEGPITRTTYKDVHLRARKTAQALTRLGVKEGDVVATMAWNTARHLEAWYGIMGMGAVCHTLNPRLFAEQLVAARVDQVDRPAIARLLQIVVNVDRPVRPVGGADDGQRARRQNRRR